LVGEHLLLAPGSECEVVFAGGGGGVEQAAREGRGAGDGAGAAHAGVGAMGETCHGRGEVKETRGPERLQLVTFSWVVRPAARPLDARGPEGDWAVQVTVPGFEFVTPEVGVNGRNGYLVVMQGMAAVSLDQRPSDAAS
jgi:hypothetical protein